MFLRKRSLFLLFFLENFAFAARFVKEAPSFLLPTRYTLPRERDRTIPRIPVKWRESLRVEGNKAAAMMRARRYLRGAAGTSFLAQETSDPRHSPRDTS